MVGIKICIRDAEGGYVLTKITWFLPLCSVEIGEALGLCEALQWMAELGMDNMDFSLDSKLVVDVVTTNNSSNTHFRSIISHCRHLLNTHFTNTKVEFSRRRVNKVTHELTHAISLEASSQLVINVPPCINEVLSNKIR